jgi:hypothetical protein
MTALEERLHHSATLLAGASRDDDGELLIMTRAPFHVSQ